MGVQGGKTYQGVQLITEEAAVLKAFEDMVGEAVPHVSEIKWSTFGFTARDGHVTGIGMFSKELPSLPEGLWDLERLEYLWLTDNRLSPFPDDVRSLRNLRQLSLNMNGLTVLPEGIWELDGMEYSCFWRNQVTEISEDLGRLRNLEEFHPAANPITSLPRSMTTLTKLRVLDLADTGITSLPEGFDRLQRLEVLNMRNTRLSSFPMEVCRLET
jgi:Leucine-rich repeat (LRR) protein